MSEAWVDSVDSEALGEGVYDSEALGEGAYDSEAYGEGAYDAFGEESRSARRQRERQRQIVLARQRQAQLRQQRQPAQVQRPAPPAGPSQRQTITAIRFLDPETKVGQDSLRRALEASNRRAARATWAAVASAAVDQGTASWPWRRTRVAKGRFTVTASSRFYSLSLLLSDAYYRENKAAVEADKRIGAGADPGLVYARWNMGRVPLRPAAGFGREAPHGSGLHDGRRYPALTGPVGLRAPG